MAFDANFEPSFICDRCKKTKHAEYDLNGLTVKWKHPYGWKLIDNTKTLCDECYKKFNEFMENADVNIVRCKDCKHRPILAGYSIYEAVMGPVDINGNVDETCPYIKRFGFRDVGCYKLPDHNSFCDKGESHNLYT